MRRRAALAIMVAVGSGSVALSPAAGAVGASRAPAITPKPGQYAAATHGGHPSFVVGKKRKVVSHLLGTAPTGSGCTLTGGYAVPPFNTPLKDGRFSESSSAYGGLEVTVTIAGRFVSATTVKGQLVVRYSNARYRRCDAVTKFSATRVKRST
jgi:hypothetical protein